MMMMMMMTKMVCTSQKTHRISITKTKRLMMYRDKIVVYFENYTKHINTFCGGNAQLLNVQTGGTYSNHYTVNAYAEITIEYAPTISVYCYYYGLVLLSIKYQAKE
jgi:hypothetical protein